MITILIAVLSTQFSATVSACPTNVNEVWTDCVSAYTFADGERYVGEWKDNKMHGQGTITYGKDSQWAGEKYVGEFKDGNKHGQGTTTFDSGDKYVGEHKNNERHGQGTYTFGKDSKWAGEKYVGEYKNNKRHGQGTYTTADGKIYKGLFRNDEFLGANN